MKDFIKNYWKDALVYFISAVLIGLIINGADKDQDYVNERTYNHGVCTECGGHYEFINAAKDGKHLARTYYYYKCDRCEKIIELVK